MDSLETVGNVKAEDGVKVGTEVDGLVLLPNYFIVMFIIGWAIPTDIPSMDIRAAWAPTLTFHIAMYGSDETDSDVCTLYLV